MFATFFNFELRYWTRGMMLYVFAASLTIAALVVISNENVVIGGIFSNSNCNAPFVIQTIYAELSTLCGLMVTAFVCGAAIRDFRYRTQPMLFTKPVNKYSYLMGRFWGATLIALLPMLGITLGSILGSQMPWVDAGKVGPTYWTMHLTSILVFAIPNTLLIAAIVFAFSLWIRKTAAAFVVVLFLIMGNVVARGMLGNLDYELAAGLIDPFGMATFDSTTKYWTVADQNTRWVGLDGILVVNRLLWFVIGQAILLLACWKFTGSHSKSSDTRHKILSAESNTEPKHVDIPTADVDFSTAANLSRSWSQCKVEFWAICKSPIFLIVLFAGLVNLIPSLFANSDEGFGISSLPVTYQVIGSIRNMFTLFSLIVVAFYSGSLVWKERESKLDEIYDATPTPSWVAFCGKLAALMGIVAVTRLGAIAIGIASQLYGGFMDINLGLYVKELLIIDFVQYFSLAVLALFSQIISPNKYAGYFLLIILSTVNLFLWPALEVETYLVQFGQLPDYVYSDFYGLAPYGASLLWFGIYWVLFSIVLCMLAISMWRRGREQGVKSRLAIAGNRIKGKLGFGIALGTTSFLTCGAWIFFNTHIINEVTGQTTIEQRGADYELTFADYAQLPQPRVTKINYEIDIFPSQRKIELRGVQTIKNKTEQPLEHVFVSMTQGFSTHVEIAGASKTENHPDQYVQIFHFDTPLASGEETKMSFQVEYSAKGFENELQKIEIVQNGTFINNKIVPQIGFQRSRMLADEGTRERLGLPPITLMPDLDPNDHASRMNHYVSNNSDWVDVETVISTSDDQIAVAPGSLIEHWSQDGRKYFRYRLDRPSLNFYSFVSGRYQVTTRQWKGVDIEIYHHPKHHWNVDKMLISVRKSLEYYTQAFGPYPHQQARIIEFPRWSRFAQAFPGTMPYSEGIGFIADLRPNDAVDKVFYVVAHEMAHQWWAHQVMGAEMKGATLLSETLAQYSALVVMEKELGNEIMRKYLRYELDSYLQGRSLEKREERPLAEVLSQQTYVHYRKGSVAMYCLKEMIGEDKVNAALRELVDRFSYQEPPYPTSLDLVDALRKQTPADYQYLIDDLFHRIILFSNKTTEASYIELENGKFEVTMDVECRKYEAGKEGAETEIEINDWIEIAAFAQPSSGSRFGETIYRDRIRITENQRQIKFVVDQKPNRVGIDPFQLLIDREPTNNTIRPLEK